VKRVEINLKEFLNLHPMARKNFIESKLKEAGFDMNQYILAIVDSKNMKYVYSQMDKSDWKNKKEKGGI